MTSNRRHEGEKSQADKFRDAARELETDQSEEAFNRTVKGIAKKKPRQKDDMAKEE